MLTLDCVISSVVLFSFTDIDECIDGSNNCHENAGCTNIDGSFTCECNNGYNGNGELCEGENTITLSVTVKFILTLLCTRAF